MSRRPAHNKHSAQFIQDWAEQHNMILLDNDYVNNNHKHRWLCKTHNEEHTATYDKIRVNGQLKCCSRANSSKRKLDLVVACCEQHNLTLVGEYKDSQTPTTWMCNVHREVHETTRFNIEHSRGALPCCIAGKSGHTLQQIQAFADQRRLTFDDPKYLGSHHKHTWTCKVHNYTHQTTYAVLSSGSLLECCHKELTSGPNHPNYNHNVSDIQRIKDRRSDENKRWRNAVLQRDNHACQKCTSSISETKLNAHHIMSYLDNEHLRFDVNNGITLCVECHKRFHKIYGNGSNNVQQLLEFIKL